MQVAAVDVVRSVLRARKLWDTIRRPVQARLHCRWIRCSGRVDFGIARATVSMLDARKLLFTKSRPRP
jgi:hypothetical protein